ncbi:MAG: anti-sigma factor family protein [Ilumatobacteraceae bacterium]
MLQPVVRCVEFVDTVSDWMEGALSDDQRLLLEEHLVICPDCAAYLAQLRLAVSVLRAVDDADEGPSRAAREALLTAFRRRHSR